MRLVAWTAIVVRLILAGHLCADSTGSIESPAPANNVAVYDPDPKHLWNRLHAAVYARTYPDGRQAGQDEVDPLIWRASRHILAGTSYRQAIGTLDEFLGTEGKTLIKDPVKRAVLQHDLWAIFDWLADDFAQPAQDGDRYQDERRQLQNRLVQALRQVALTPSQIETLPDNYATAIAAATYPGRYDQHQRGQRYLPPDLLKSSGPWVMIEDRGEGVAAPAHVAFCRGRSAFFVFLNLPAGREATLAYLKELRGFPNPLMPRPSDGGQVFTGPVLNPSLPQFPAGTQVALLREMLVIDDGGVIKPTPLIESLQLRVYRKIPRPAARASAPRTGMDSGQDVFEFNLRRRNLFKGTTSGLVAVADQDREYPLFGSHNVDPFETAGGTHGGQVHIMQRCAACHVPPGVDGPGIRSVQTYTRSMAPPAGLHPPDLVDCSRTSQERAAIRWKRQHYSWGLLEGLANASAATR
jgi:hypothetical protein